MEVSALESDVYSESVINVISLGAIWGYVLKYIGNWATKMSCIQVAWQNHNIAPIGAIFRVACLKALMYL